MTTPRRILYIVHDGGIYGSQKSLLLMLSYLKTHQAKAFEPFVSLARDGALSDHLASVLSIPVLRHKRLQWFKHDRRNILQRVTDLFGLLLNLPGRVCAVYKHIKRHKIDLVHTNSVVSLEGAVAAKLAGIPHVWHIRELFMEDSPKLIPVLGKTFTRALITRLSDTRPCISKSVREQFLPKDQPDSPLIYNALSPEQISASIDNPADVRSPLRLGYVGRISEGKGLHELLAALHHLKRLIPDQPPPTLSVAGNFVDDAYRKRIETLVTDYALGDHVSFLGYQDDLSRWYPTVDLVVVPSKNEPFGRVVIESMAANVPCIGADSGGIPEIITHDETGWLYPTGNPEALAQIILKLNENPAALADVIQKAGRMVLERFTIEQQMFQICHLYNRLLHRDI